VNHPLPEGWHGTNVGRGAQLYFTRKADIARESL
jgi:hypothetical protein